jgi:DNA-binding NarL/FixJ family response regulator
MTSNSISKPEIIIVDDHVIFRQGLKSLLASERIATVIGEASNGKEYLELLSNLKPDLVLMDIDMPHMNGMEATQKSLAMHPDLKIIAFTMFGDEDYYYKMIDLGVKGFLLKSSGISELEKAISEVLGGESYFSNEILRKIINKLSHKDTAKKVENIGLTAREMDVLEQICLGLNNDEIADKLFISPKTVKSHRSNLLVKTNCSNSTKLILYALKNKIVNI